MSTLIKSPGSMRLWPREWYDPIDHFFRSDFPDMWRGEPKLTVPSINIREEKDNYIIEMAAPGLKKDDFNIDLDGNLLTISCEKETETQKDNGSDGYAREEYNYSSFTRSFTLPENAEAGRVAAQYTDGVLTLNVPKNAETRKNKTQRIKVA